MENEIWSLAKVDCRHLPCQETSRTRAHLLVQAIALLGNFMMDGPTNIAVDASDVRPPRNRPVLFGSRGEHDDPWTRDGGPVRLRQLQSPVYMWRGPGHSLWLYT